jgi:hypothetical protein
MGIQFARVESFHPAPLNIEQKIVTAHEAIPCKNVISLFCSSDEIPVIVRVLIVKSACPLLQYHSPLPCGIEISGHFHLHECVD